MSNKDAPLGKSPMKVAWSIVVSRVATKSSAASISSSPALGGLEAIPIDPSGDPVLKLKGELAYAPWRDAEPEKTIPTSNGKKTIGDFEDPKVRFKPATSHIRRTLIFRSLTSSG